MNIGRLLNSPVVLMVAGVELVAFLSIYAFVLLGKAGFASMPYERALNWMWVLLVVFAWIVFAKKGAIVKKKPLTNPYFIGLLVTTVLGYFMAILRGSPLLYVVSDTFYVAMQAIVFILGYTYARRQPPERIIYYIVVVCNFGLVLALLLRVLGVEIPSPLNILLLVGLGTSLISYKGWRRIVLVLLFFAVILLGIKNSDRSYLGSAFGVFILLSISGIFRGTPRLIRLASVLFGIFIVGMFLYQSGYITTGALAGRITRLTDVANGGSIKSQVALYERIYEAEQVWKQVQKSSISLIIGCGPGAVLDLSRAPDPTVRAVSLLGGGHVHNVHLLLFSILFKYGTIGVLGLLWLAWRLVVLTASVTSYRGNRQFGATSDLPLLLVCVIYLDAIFVYSITASGFMLTDTLFPLFAGFAFSLQDIRAERRKDKKVVIHGAVDHLYTVETDKRSNKKRVLVVPCS